MKLPGMLAENLRWSPLELWRSRGQLRMTYDRCPAPKLFGSMNINNSHNERNNKDISMATVSVHQGPSTISRIQFN